MIDATRHYARLAERLRRCADLGAALRLLEWDQETYMPPGASDERARQIGALAELVHEQHTAPDLLDSVDGLAAEPAGLDSAQAADVRELKWQLDRERALPGSLVRDRAELRANARSAWIVARRDDDFPFLAPHLERLVAMERNVAANIDPNRHPYEVLLEGYEPGLTLDALERMLDDVGAGLAPLVERIHSILARHTYPASPLQGSFDPTAQRRFNRDIVAAIGFDFERGRIDESEHPFSTSIGSDVRLTTRYDPDDLAYSLYSSLHEAGHGLYEQGLEPRWQGLPRGTACSLGIHESQSRLWENQVGRSAAFWEFALPQAQAAFPALAETTVGAILLGVNRIEPSFIRTEADELTYNLHILVRYDIERALISDDLRVGDLQGAWRERMLARLGIAPSDDRQGVLQDVHWSAGEFGYFPTYTLGNVYAAQLYERAAAELGDLEALLRRGEFTPLRDWLRRNVHQHGQRYRAAELIERATGQPASAAPLLRHLEATVAWLEHAIGAPAGSDLRMDAGRSPLGFA